MNNLPLSGKNKLENNIIFKTNKQKKSQENNPNLLNIISHKTPKLGPSANKNKWILGRASGGNLFVLEGRCVYLF